MIITITTPLHEQLHKTLYNKFLKALIKRELDEKWKEKASGQYGRPGKRGKEGDSSGGPKPERNSKGDWPTLVIEAGYSKTLANLHEDMKWWFRESNHQVKIVLLVKFDGQIRLERWEEEEIQVPAHSGATTRHSTYPRLEPRRQQIIIITRNTTTDPVSYDVDRTALELKFRLLFLRDPVEGEEDITIGIDDLKKYAEDVWSEV